MSSSNPVVGGQWILARKAPAYLRRPRSTVYRWVEQDKVRSMQPLQELWLYLPDLQRADLETPRRHRAKSSESSA